MVLTEYVCICYAWLDDDQNTEMSGNDQEPAIAVAATTKKFRQKTPFIERIAQLGICLSKKKQIL